MKNFSSFDHLQTIDNPAIDAARKLYKDVRTKRSDEKSVKKTIKKVRKKKYEYICLQCGHSWITNYTYKRCTKCSSPDIERA